MTSPGRARTAPNAALSPSRPFWVVFGYLLAMCLAASTTLNWFRRGYFVAAGDINPFLREGMASELGSLWNHQLSGAGSPSYDVARSLDVLFISLVELLGGSPATAQHVFMASIMAFASFGSTYFARAFTRSLIASVAVGILGPINPFVLVLIPNPIFVMSIGVGGTLGGLIVRSAANDAPPFPVFALALIPVSYLSVNPPLLAVLVLWSLGLVMTSSLHGAAYSFKAAAAYVAKAAPLAVLISLWWIVPLYLTVLGGSESVDVAAQTDASAWSWSHAENSLINVITLKAHWGWPYPEYYPYAARLDTGIWPWLRLLFPLTAVASLVVVRPERRKTVAVFVAVAVVMVLVAKGIHDPYKGLNLWMYNRIPGFWLLREPMSKVGPLLVLAYVALSALTIDGILKRVSERSQGVSRAAKTALILVLFGGAMAPQPLWSGGVVTADRAPLPSSHVQVPDEWYAIADAVNATPESGKSILLPLNSYYQVTTNWGYHGVDSFFDQLTNRPTLQRLPGGYFSPPYGVDYLMATLEQRLIDGDEAAIKPLLRSLGATNLVIRSDLGVTSAPNADRVEDMLFTAAAAIDAGPIIENSVGSVFNVPSAEFVRVADTAIGTVSDNAPDGAPVASLPMSAVGVTLDNMVNGVLWEPSSATESITFELEADQTLIASTGVEDKTLTIASAKDERLRLESSGAVTIGLRTLFDPVALEFDVVTDRVLALQRSNRAEPRLLRSASLFAFDPGEQVAALGASGASLLGNFNTPENCARTDDRTGAALGHVASASGATVSLEAKAHAACIWAPIETNAAMVHLRFKYKSNGTALPRFCMWQDGLDSCASAPPLRLTTELTDYEALVALDPAADSIRLFVYADGQDNGTTTQTRYEDISVVPVTTIDTAIVTKPETYSIDLPAGDHSLQVTGESQITSLSDFQPLEDCGRFDDRTPEELGFSRTIDDTKITLTADAHSACVWLAVPTTQSEAIRLRFDYQTVSGSAARVCLWQEGLNKCAPLEPLTTSPDWQTSQSLAFPDPAATELKLFLYADGLDTGEPTVTRYRDLSAEPTTQTQVSLLPESGSNSAPGLTWSRVSSSRYAVDIDGADGSFVLSLSDAASDGWEIDGLPDGWNAESIVVDGYAIGWNITGTGDAHLAISYAPDRTAQLAIKISILTGLGVIAVLLVGAVRKRRRDRLAVSAIA